MTLLCNNNSSVRLPPEEHICYLYSYSMDYAIYQIVVVRDRWAARVSAGTVREGTCAAGNCPQRHENEGTCAVMILSLPRYVWTSSTPFLIQGRSFAPVDTDELNKKRAANEIRTRMITLEG